jgi:LuxR family maltose regulon positive regulatory protein
LSLAEELRLSGSGTGLAEWVDAARVDLEAARVTSRQRAGTTTPRRQPESDLVLQPLTKREITILELLASHLSLPEIGVELHISRHTVKSHVGRIYGKLGTTSRSGAVRIGRELGILG